MPTFYDPVALDDIDINDHAAKFYLLQTDKTTGNEKYKVCATTQDLSSSQMKFDPVTKIKEYWPITRDQLNQANLSILFPDDKLCNEPLAITDLDKVFKYDPKIPAEQNKAFHFDPQIPPEKFGPKAPEQSRGLMNGLFWRQVVHDQRSLPAHIQQEQQEERLARIQQEERLARIHQVP